MSLICKIHSCNDLFKQQPKTDIVAYVVVRLGKQMRQSKMVKCVGNNITWDEKFMFKWAKEEKLSLDIHNVNDDVICRLELPLNGPEFNGVVDIPMTNLTAGRIEVSYKTTDNKTPGLSELPY